MNDIALSLYDLAGVTKILKGFGLKFTFVVGSTIYERLLQATGLYPHEVGGLAGVCRNAHLEFEGIAIRCLKHVGDIEDTNWVGFEIDSLGGVGTIGHFANAAITV